MEATQEALIPLKHWFDYWRFLILANVRPLSFQSIPTKLTSISTSFYSTPHFTSISLYFPWCFSFFTHVSSLKFLSRLKVLRCNSASSWDPLRSLSLFCIKLFFGPFSIMPHSDGFLFLALPTLELNWNAFTDCLLSSPIPLLLSEASLPPLRVTRTHFDLSFYEGALRLSISFFISG